MGIVEDVFSSDHLPIYLDFIWGIVRSKRAMYDTQINRVFWGDRDESQMKEYHDLCNTGLGDIDFLSNFNDCEQGFCDNPGHKNLLNIVYDQIVNTLREAAVKTKQSKIILKHCRRKARCGWNKHVKYAHREARLAFKMWVQNNRPTAGYIYEQMCYTRKIFKSRVKWCINNQDQIKMNKLAKLRADKNFIKFWKCTSKLDVKPGLPTSVSGVSDPEGIANLFMEHFRVRSPLGSSRTVHDPVPSATAGKPMLMFSSSEVRDVIKRMRSGKSPGHDGLSIEHLKHAGVHLPRILALFFNLCIKHIYLPTDLMKTVVVPIVKNRVGDISDKNNYRPISLATVVAKVLDSLLESCLQKYIKLHDAQFGFRPSLSTESAILGLKHTVEYYTSRKTPVYACFLDLSKAFDLVSYDVLWRKMEDMGIPVEVVSLFRFWYAKQTNNVKWATKLSSVYVLGCGVRQGGLSSPKLFNLYVNNLIEEISNMRVGCRVGGVSVNNISYADDMALLSPTARGIGEMLKVCEKYAASHGLTYNVSKSVIMVFKAAGKCPECIPPIRLGGKELNKVSNFKYLGHILADDLKDDLDIERERRALAIRGNMLARRFARCTDEVKITLFKTFCQNLYTGGLWILYAKGSLNILRIQYNNIFRMMLRLPRFCSASEMFAQARTDGFRALMRKKVASLISRVRESDNSILRVVADDLHAPILRNYMWTMNEFENCTFSRLRPRMASK